MKAVLLRTRLDCFLDMLFSNLLFASLIDDQTGQMKRIGMVGLDAENLPVKRFCFNQPPGIVVLQRGLQGTWDGCSGKGGLGSCLPLFRTAFLEFFSAAAGTTVISAKLACHSIMFSLRIRDKAGITTLNIRAYCHTWNCNRSMRDSTGIKLGLAALPNGLGNVCLSGG
ncbi:MAG: hypothetical protein U1C96_00565 [Gallionella sp.]|nr:hypothetical protein [Gallionella sp.]